MKTKCWICEEEKPTDAFCEGCSSLLETGAMVCLDCCICHFRTTFTTTTKETGDASG